MSITAVSIQNFRSIRKFKTTTKDLNIFVGQNDEGKSNVLRALDLFFNSGKKNGYDLDWERDYCYFAKKQSRKADELIIQLEITPPKTFKIQRPVLWTKVWRRGGLFKDDLKYTNGRKIGGKSKIYAFLRAMRFDYVPAMKGEEYFRTLMSRFYDMMEATVEDQIRNASSSFTKTINKNTKDILSDIQKQLDLKTTIELPKNLRELFAQLQFTSVTDGKPFMLDQLGDGIRVRHIPIVLRWLAKQANSLSDRGRPKAVTIWGFEEPENNLELRRCFDIAKEFVDNSDSIQTFVTTHSPAFYSVCRESSDEKIKLFLVEKNSSPPTSNISEIEESDLYKLDSSMGLLNILEPYFKEAREEIKRLKEAGEKLSDTSKPTIFVEGPSDKVIIGAVLKDYYPQLVDKIVIQCSTSNGGGYTWVGDMMTAWSYSRPKANAVGLFDKDSEAQETRKEINRQIKRSSDDKVFGVSLIPGDELKKCYTKKISVPFAIEELLPEEVWDHAEQQGWLEDRSNLLQIYSYHKTDISFDDYISNKLPEKHLRRLTLQKVKNDPDAKKKFSQYVAKIPKDKRKQILEGIIPTLDECLKKLKITEVQL